MDMCVGGGRRRRGGGGSHVHGEESGEVEQRVVAVAEHLADHELLGLAIAHHPMLPAEVLEPAGARLLLSSPAGCMIAEVIAQQRSPAR